MNIEFTLKTRERLEHIVKTQPHYAFLYALDIAKVLIEQYPDIQKDELEEKYIEALNIGFSK